MLTRRDLGKHTSKCYSGNLHFLLQCFQETAGYIEKLKKKKKKPRKYINRKFNKTLINFTEIILFNITYKYTHTHTHRVHLNSAFCAVSHCYCTLILAFFSSNAINSPHHSGIVIRTKLFFSSSCETYINIKQWTLMITKTELAKV